MQSLPKNNILEFNPETLENVRKRNNFNKPEELVEAVDIFNNWVQKQEHFTRKDFSREYLEIAIITSKGSIERAKARLDKICTYRTFLPQYFDEFNLREYVQELDMISFAFLPKLTKEHNRVLLFRNNGKKFEPTINLHLARMLIMFIEYLKSHDYTNSIIVLVDNRELDYVEVMKKLNFVEVRQSLSILIGGFGLRIEGVYVLSKENKAVTFVVNMFKQVLNPKVAERIQLFDDVAPVYKFIPKKILPVEYGGEEKPLTELYEAWIEELSSEEYMAYQKEMSSARTDESLRKTDTFNDMYMGLPGTFRALSVD